MSANKDQKRQKENPIDKTLAENKKQGFQLPGKGPKPFQQFSNPSKFQGGPPKPSSRFHRPSGK